MTPVTLVHNTKAGYGRLAKDQLLRLLRRSGYASDYYAANDDALDDALRDPGELVVVAGGDGTVGRVASTLVGHRVPIALLPQGTANNVAAALGWKGSPKDIVAAWSKARPKAFDVGRADGPWGRRCFFEAAGVGLFPEALPQVSARKKQDSVTFERPGDELKHDAKGLKSVLADLPARPWQIALDGEDLSGKYLMVEAMNICTMGPGLRLAPAANADDGLLNVVLLTEEDREGFLQYLDGCAAGNASCPDVNVRTGRQLEIRWEGGLVHVDDAVWAEHADEKKIETPAGTLPHVIRLSLHPGALRMITNTMP